MAPIKPCFGNKFSAGPCIVVHSFSHSTPLKANVCGINNGCTTSLETGGVTRRGNCTYRFCLSTGRGGCVSRYNTTGFFNVGGGACIAPGDASVLPSVAGGDLVRLTRSLNVGMRHHRVPRSRLSAFRRTNTYNATTIVDPVDCVSSLSANGHCGFNRGPNPISGRLCSALHNVRCNAMRSGRN